MTLSGKRIVVGGGTGDVGSAIVDVLSHAGAHVLVPARDMTKAAALWDQVRAPERVEIIDGFPTDEAGIGDLSSRLMEAGPIDGAVASLGSWFTFGPLTKTPLKGFRRAFESLLCSHFLFARAVVPALRPGSTLVMVNGAGSEEPVPNSAAVSIMAHGLSMLFESLVVENPRLHIHMLMLRSVIATRARRNPDPSWVTAEQVGETAHWLFSPQGQRTAGTVVALTPRNVRLAEP